MDAASAGIFSPIEIHCEPPQQPSSPQVESVDVANLAYLSLTAFLTSSSEVSDIFLHLTNANGGFIDYLKIPSICRLSISR